MEIFLKNFVGKALQMRTDSLRIYHSEPGPPYQVLDYQIQIVFIRTFFDSYDPTNHSIKIETEIEQKIANAIYETIFHTKIFKNIT
jgi:hypothetical protein